MSDHARKPAEAARSQRRRARRAWLRAGLAVVASGAMAGGLALAGPAGASVAGPAHRHVRYSFRTLNNSNDPTFNQLLGINNRGVIAGYFGSGAAGHPNKGYFLLPRYGQLRYRIENFPGSVQTQVTGLNDGRITVGFWSNANNASLVNANFGFYAIGGRRFHTVSFPTRHNATPPVNQLLGVNDRAIAVGFYTDAQGNNHGYTFNIRRNRFRRVLIPEATSVTAAAINNENHIAGFFTSSGGTVDGFLLRGHRFTGLAFPGATMTMATGVNDLNEVVGVYQLGSGSTATLHGFTWTRRHGFTTVDDPHGVGATTVNGVNDAGDLVGFYVDSAGNTDGMLARP